MPSSSANFQLPQSKFGLGSDHSDLVVFLVRYFRIVAMVFVVWVIGYLNFSLSWILLAVFLYLLRDKKRTARTIKSEMIKAIGINEKDALMARLDEVPSWVYFPDRERAEWLNKVIKQMWPNLRVYISKQLIEQIEPIINQYSTAFIGKVRFDEIDLGDIPPRVGGIKVYTENIQNGEIVIDLEVLYAGDAQVKMEFKRIVAGVKDIQFQGEFRVILKPLCNRIPFCATMTLFLLKMPQIDFNLTQLANTFDMPGLRKLIDSTIEDVVSKILVLPNRLVIPLMTDFDITELDSMKSLKPRGILRCHVIKGQNLKNADFGLFGKGKSDPYVKISGLGMPKTTKVINNDLNPVWNETFDFIIDEINLNPTLLFEVYDKDDLNDDFLGVFDVNVERIMTKRKEEGFYKLKNVTHGELYLRLEWYFLSSDKIKLSQIRKLKEFKANQATCVLLVDLKSANELPFANKKGGGLSEPDPRVVLMVRDCISTSSSKPRTTNPKWNENHYFFINNPEDERLVCKIEDEKTKSTIAYCDVPVFELLNEENLSVERKFDLTCMQAGYLPKLTMRLTLRILSPSKENEETIAAGAGESSSNPAIVVTRPVMKKESSIPNSKFVERIEDTAMKLRENGHQDEPDNKSILTTPPDKLSSGSFMDPKVFGMIRLSMRYQLDDGVFILQIHECRNLRMVHKSNLPDAYIKCILLPDKRTKKKTRFVKDTLNPIFDERLQWNITLSDLKKSQLLLTVKNHHFILTNEKSFIGQLLIDLSSFDVETVSDHWYELRDKDDAKFFADKIDGSHNIRSSLEKHLHLKESIPNEAVVNLDWF